MKRIITCLLFSVMSLGIYAQFSNGYYRLKCKETGRYLAVHNDYVNKESAKRTGQVDLQSLETIEGFDNIVNDPGSVVFLKKTSKGYVIEAQGFTTEGKGFYLQFTQVNDAYRIWTTIKYEGTEYTRYLRDYIPRNGQSYITTDAEKSTNWHWYITPISDSDYFGLKGDVKVGDNYYTTIYAAFPMQLGSGMKAYAVNTLSESSCTLEDIGNVVPGKTSVVIKCAGKDASSNKVVPLKSTDASVEGNKLNGVVFCYPVIVAGSERRDSPMWNAKDYVPETMRLLGEDNGKLCFITSNEVDYLAANRAYLPVASGSAASIPTDGTTAIKSIINQAGKRNSAKGRFTLQGVRIPDNIEPQKGFYIEDGQLKLKK